LRFLPCSEKRKEKRGERRKEEIKDRNNKGNSL
jgi:hypothetical protein